MSLQLLVRVIFTFSSASVRILQREEVPYNARRPEAQRSLRVDEWTAAVVKGVDGGMPPARQVLVFAGLLQGLQSQGGHELGRGLRTMLKAALVKAVNLSLRNDVQRLGVTDLGLVVALSQVFDFLDMREKAVLDHDSLLPMLIWAVFFSNDGLHQGYFLSTIDADVEEGAGGRFSWSIRSHSYFQLRSTSSGPLVVALGRLSRLTAFSIGHATGVATLARMLQDLFGFSRSLSIQWRQNKLSEIDISEETLFLTEETLRTPLPLLWRVLRSSMYAIVVILTSYTGRLLSDKLGTKDDGQ